MRILHTSDWHLGVRHGAISRADDHDRFLGWLEQTLADGAFDALIIAGDVFDSMQPSADAQARYYGLLGRLGSSGLRQVVVVGGNHDSAARLDAPAGVLTALRVHVVGGIGGTEASWDRCLVPLRDAQGAVGAVVLAVPYVHEFRLGVRTTDLDREAVRAQFRTRFTALYRWLADQAQARWPGVPLVATGHLTLGTARRQDYPHEIHQVGTLEGLPEAVLDPRIQYTALGHIHRAYPADSGQRAWYSGSPIALSLPEAETPRRVLQVDLAAEPDGKAQVSPLMVPAPRGLVALRAGPDELVAQVRTLTWSEPLPPLLFCRVVADAHPTDLTNRLHEALEAHPEDGRPALVELRQERATPLSDDDPEAPAPPLHELDPSQVFQTLCRAHGLTDTTALDAAFGSLSSASTDDFDAMLATVRGAQP